MGTQLRRNVFSGSLAMGAQICILAVSYPVYLHYLGYETYGLWLVVATVLVLSQLGNLGVSQALMKFVAEHLAQGALDEIQSSVSNAILILLLTGSILVVGVNFFSVPIIAALGISKDLTEVAAWLLPLVAALSAYVLIVEALHGVLSGLGRMDLANYAKLGGRLVGSALSIAMLILGGNLESLLIGSTIGWMATHLILFLCIRNVSHVRFFDSRSYSREKIRTLLGFGAPLVGASAAELLLGPFNKIMLSNHVGLESVPIFEIAHRGAMEVRGVVANGLGALMPEISSLSGQQSWERIRQLNTRAQRWVFLLGVSLYLPIIATLGILLPLWLGSRYVDPLSLIARIALVGSFLSLIGVPAYFTLLGVGRVTACLAAHGVQSLVNVIIVLVATQVGPGLSLQLMAVSVGAGYGCTALFLLWRRKTLFRHVRLASAQ